MTAVPAAVVVGPGPAPAARPRPVLRAAVCAMVGLAVLWLLARRVGGPAAAAHALASASPTWLMITVLAASGSYVAAGVAQRGASAGTVPLRRLVVVQVACAFTNRLLPAGVGGMATNVRGLQKAGLPAARARLAVAVTAVVGVAMHVVTVVAAAPLLVAAPAVRHLLVSPAGPGLPVDLLLLAAAVAGVGLLRHPPVRALVARTGRRLGVDRAELLALARSPRDLARLCGGSLGITACHAAAFVTALHAVGLALPLATVLALYVAAVAVAGLVPTPGGIGGVDAALLLGLTAVGTAAAPAAAAVLVFRLLTFWLPVLPGAAALLWALRHDWL